MDFDINEAETLQMAGLPDLPQLEGILSPVDAEAEMTDVMDGVDVDLLGPEGSATLDDMAHALDAGLAGLPEVARGLGI